MDVVALLFAGFLIVVSLVYAGLKALIVHDYSSGGVPVLDGYIFPPLFLSVGATFLFRYFHVGVSGLVVAVVAFVALSATYQVAWWLGKHRNR